jgi:cytoskeletal protein CcmA (bactofilin family)
MARTTTRGGGGGDAVIGRSTRVRGRIAGDGDLRLEGSVEGDITLSGALTVTGELAGDIRAEGGVHIEAGARVKGDIQGESVAIDDGAEYSGRLIADFELPAELGGGGSSGRRR